MIRSTTAAGFAAFEGGLWALANQVDEKTLVPLGFMIGGGVVLIALVWRGASAFTRIEERLKNGDAKFEEMFKRLSQQDRKLEQIERGVESHERRRP